jgi:L-threonylcarbamoyladenylate synthase
MDARTPRRPAVTAGAVLRIDPERPDGEALARAAEVLRAGGLVAFPTETVYGLGADALDPAAVRRIYEAKGRPGYNPLIVHVADAGAARELAAVWPAAAERLAAAFWPGPLTLVVPKAAHVPDEVTAGLSTVALRVPSHPVALALLRAAGIPLAAPSANRSTAVSPTRAEHVVRGLGARVDLVLDGGPCPVGIESTVVSLAGPVPTILRPGTLSADAIAAVAGEVAPASTAAEEDEEAARPSPGMMDRHYAPEAELVSFPTSARDALMAEAAARAAAGHRVAAIVLGAPSRTEARVHVVALPDDAEGYAARFYAVLHELDADGYTRVYVEEPPEQPAWAGVRDRLRRALTLGPGDRE